MGETSVKIMLVIFNLIFIAFIGAIVMFIRQYRIKKRGHAKELEMMDLVHRKEMLETQTEIQKETMKYIGREIHDNVGQKLTLSSLYLQQLTTDKVSKMNDEIMTVNEIINESLEELRNLSKSLTDDTIENNLISELLLTECQKVNNLKQCFASFTSNLDFDIKSYQMKSIILRITQEFLQNSIKHSNCNNILVSLNKGQDSLNLELSDDGKGFSFEEKESKGIGLRNIRKRIELINGTFELKSESSFGTRLKLKIPL